MERIVFIWPLEEKKWLVSICCPKIKIKHKNQCVQPTFSLNKLSWLNKNYSNFFITFFIPAVTAVSESNYTENCCR